MDKSETLPRLAKLAAIHLGHNLLDLGIANSYYDHESPGDIDTLLVVDKLNPEALAQFLKQASEQLNIKVSGRVFTPLMYATYCLEPKIAVVLYKGATFSSGKSYPLSLPQLQAIIQPQLPAAIAEISAAVSSGKLAYPKAYDLLVQFLVLCHQNKATCWSNPTACSMAELIPQLQDLSMPA